MPKPTSGPDQFGRVRVRDDDTGHVLSIHVSGLPHGNYTVLSEPASTPGGDELPPVHKSPVEPTPTSGQQAETMKEKDNG